MSSSSPPPAAPSSSAGAERTALVARAVLLLARRLRAERTQPAIGLSALGLLATLHRLGPMPAARLAREERLQPQSLSRLIAALERRGMIERKPDSADRRLLVLAVTEAGRDVLGRDMRARRAWLEDAMASHLTATEQESLAAAAELLLRLAAKPTQRQRGDADSGTPG